MNIRTISKDWFLTSHSTGRCIATFLITITVTVWWAYCLESTAVNLYTPSTSVRASSRFYNYKVQIISCNNTDSNSDDNDKRYLKNSNAYQYISIVHKKTHLHWQYRIFPVFWYVFLFAVSYLLRTFFYINI